MSGTLTYNDRYNHWRDYEICRNTEKLQFEIEKEVLIRLLCGKTQYQQMILNHTCAEMFTDRDIRAIYVIISKYVQKRGINKLNPIDVIDSLRDDEIKYIEYIMHLKDWFICSADSENWIMRLHVRYENQLFAGCKSISDLKLAEKELIKYKLYNTECKLFDTAVQYINDYDKKAENIIKTYYPSIDKLISGFQGGNYTILAGSTGMGKTAMALNLIINMAKHNKNILLFSFEMTPDELLTRIIANELKIPTEAIRNRNLSQDDLNKYVEYIDSNDFEVLQNSITIPAIVNLNISKLEEIVKKSNADIIFIDYLGLIKGDDTKNSTYEQVSDISRRLKLLAIETNKPLIVLHQLNRDMKDRRDKHPKLSDIRDSGKIEQDADFICFVYRPAYYDTNVDNTYLEFMIAKSRHTNGAGKIAQLKFDGSYQRISEREFKHVF